MTNWSKTAWAAAVLVASTALSGCGQQKASEPQANPFAGLPFVLVPDQNGNLEPRTPDGKAIAPSDTPPPDAIKAIRGVSQVTVLKVEGSCYHWVFILGRWYLIPC